MTLPLGNPLFIPIGETMPKKRESRDRGQIIEKGDYKHLVRIYIGRDANGKRKYVSNLVKGTYRQAEQKLTAMLHEMDKGSFVEPSKMSLGEFMGTWLKAKEKNLSAHTHRDYTTWINQRIIPALGHIKLSKLNVFDIQRFYDESLLSDRRIPGRKGITLAPKTIRYIHSILHGALDRAVELDLIAKNPASKCELPRLPKRGSAATILSIEETVAFLANNQESGDPNHALWRLLLTSALRPAEALALKWSDIEDNTVHVRRALNEVQQNVWEVGDTKTDGSVRDVTVSEETIAALKVHRRLQAAQRLKLGERYKDEGFIFTRPYSGQFAQPSTVRKQWYSALKKAGTQRVRLYDCRHTHISHYISVTGNVKAGSERAGHADPAMTLQVYTHTLKKDVDAAPAQLEAAFQKARMA